jgi:hypothetical protein
MPGFRIRPQKPSMDAERVLDLLGKPFAGNYVSGVAEWLKNSYDHWLRMREADPRTVIFRIHTPKGQPNRTWTMECIDFIGTSFEEISEHFQTWGSELAASRGRADWAGFGGHGNGGKFHMRENFLTSEFITYRDGRLTVFGFGQDQRYGFDEVYQGRLVPPTKALKVAEIDPGWQFLPNDIRERLLSDDPSQCHFTLVRGEGFRQKKRWRARSNFDDRLRGDAQARQALERLHVIYVSDTEIVDPLKPREIPSREGYEGGRAYDVPGSIEYDGETFRLTETATAGQLTLSVAAEPFSRRDPTHVIDIKGKHDLTIATYLFTELPISNRAGADFIYGVLRCRALEDLGLKQNDRQKLVRDDITEVVLEWLARRIDELSDELAEKANTVRKERDAAVTHSMTVLLNRWKNQFLQSSPVWMEVGPGAGAGMGGTGGGGAGGPGSTAGTEGRSSEGGGGRGKGQGGAGDSGTSGGGAGDERRRAARFPEIRVSGYDTDDDGSEVRLHPRQPVVHQRVQDEAANLWWINAQRPLADRIITEYGVESPRWRDYLFNRFVEVIQTYFLTEKYDPSDPEPLSDQMWHLIGAVHDSAADKLSGLLFTVPDATDGDRPTTPSMATPSDG